MRKIALIGFLMMHLNSYTQELFVFTEPASNMPAKSLATADNYIQLWNEQHQMVSY